MDALRNIHTAAFDGSETQPRKCRGTVNYIITMSCVYVQMYVIELTRQYDSA